MLAAVILSGGESSRMGSPKALIPFRGGTFLGYLLEVIGATNAYLQSGAHLQAGASLQAGPSLPGGNSQANYGIGLTRVVLGAHTEEISERLGLAPAVVVVNADWKSGQLSSIQAAIRSLSPEGDSTDGIILFLVDHPLVSASLVSELIRKFYESGRSIVLPTFHGRRGHPVIFARRLYDELLAADLEQGARSVVWAHPGEVLEVATEEEGVVMNLNDPEALRRARERFEGPAT